MSKLFTNKTIIIILSFIASGLVIISIWNFDIGLSPDSIAHIATANNFVGRSSISHAY